LSGGTGSRALHAIYLNFQKAFDKVPHKRLMVKVRALGIVDELYSWTENWVEDRR
jgi:ribonucleases P/MRP protein subunit RPP40